MSLHALPSVSNCIPNTMVLAEDSTQQISSSTALESVQGESNEDSAESSEEQIQDASEVSHSLNASTPELEIVNGANENNNDNVTELTEDEEQNYQSQEQRCIPESLSLTPIEPTFQVDQRDTNQIQLNVQDTNHIGSEKQPMNEKTDFSKDITSFLEVVYDLLECPVCLNHMVPPILLCESGHNICFKCRPFMTKCPLCRRSFLQTRNVALEVIARKLGLKCTHEDCHKGCLGMIEKPEQQLSVDQVTYTCPLTLYTHCYWQGNYSDIRSHMEEIHASKILVQTTMGSTWEIKLVVRDCKVIFALDEIFFYKERLDTSNSKFYIQVFYVGQHENHSRFVYHVNISSETGQQRFSIYNSTLPINDLEHTYTYSASHCTVLDYQTVSAVSKHGDLKCTLSIERQMRD